ncbi:putative Kelch repeat-containing protein [Verrucomicrobia bacterium]|nr:putative Kelch repeat-containing protein [Verrucomicrobiota bacterium]
MKWPKIVRQSCLLGAIQWLACAGAQGGTWTALAHSAPGGINTMLLLSDGTVIGANGQNAWYHLTPDIHGSYVTGTWSTISPMTDTRLYYASQVMTNGSVFVAGGEYGTGHSSAEVYDPVLNDWFFCPGSGQGFSDNISEILPNGNVLVSPVTPSTYGGTIMYSPSTDTWAAGPALFRGFYQDEASWVKLLDTSILTIDPFGTNSERYIPSLNRWVNDANVPVKMYDSQGELGPGFLLPTGRAIYMGATGHTALYAPTGTSSPGTWTAGPDLPGGFGMPDAPGAMMVTGNILCAGTYPGTYGPTNVYFEYNPVTNAFFAVPGPSGVNTNTLAPYYTRMLDLPDGTVLYSVSSSQLYVYQPAGSPLAEGGPTIVSITTNFYRSYHLTGTLLNGISEGAAYGDDAQMNTDYPLVRLTNDTSGNVYYARSYNWDSTSVMTGTATNSTDFLVPTNLPAGAYSLVVVANGNSSAPVSFTYAPDALEINPLTGFAAVGPTNGPFNPSSKTYNLINTGASPLTWAVANTSLWLTVSSTGGTLAPIGPSTNIVVSLNSNANSLAVGAYRATITFSNQTSGAVQSVPYRLQVNPLVPNGGFETGSFADWSLTGNSGDSKVGDTGQYSGDGAYIHSGFYAAMLGRTNVMGFLSQTLATVPGQLYVLSVWLDSPAASGTNQFEIFWNGTNLYNKSNLHSFSYTDLIFSVSAASANTVLEFGFRNDTNYFGLDDVTLEIEPLQITPGTGFVSTGYVGGPFSVTNENLTLRNIGTAPFTWGLANTSQWLTVSQTGGTLVANGSVQVTVGLAASASAMAAGNYTNTLLFTNQFDNSLQSLKFALQIAPSPEPLQITPLDGFTSSGPAGGPFTVTSQDFTLTNMSSQSLSWALANTSLWLNVSGSQGTLAPGGPSSTVSVSLTPAAYSLGLGTYAGTILFTNLSDGAIISRVFSLDVNPLVQNGGFETGDFSFWTETGAFSDCFVSTAVSYVHSGRYGAEMGPSGSLSYLSQTLVTMPGQLYLLSFWLDSPDGASPNEFLVAWGGTTLFDQTNLPGFMWTNLVCFVNAATTNTVLEFGFRDDPSYLGLDDVSVSAVSVPAFSSVTTVAGNVVLTWNAQTGMVYQAQYNTDLTQTNWLNLGSPITATNTTLILADPLADPQRFYRIVLLP